MKNIIKILIVTSLISLVGCAAPKPVIKVQTEYRYLDYPTYLLKDCIPSQPPSMEIYVTLPYIDKENLLTNYVVALLTDIEKCNLKFKALRKLQSSFKSSLFPLGE